MGTGHQWRWGWVGLRGSDAATLWAAESKGQQN